MIKEVKGFEINCDICGNKWKRDGSSILQDLAVEDVEKDGWKLGIRKRDGIQIIAGHCCSTCSLQNTWNSKTGKWDRLNAIAKDYTHDGKKYDAVIAWWSGGIASAVTCKLCIDLYGKDRVRVIFQDTKNECDDTYRFLRDCEAWYGLPIEIICDTHYKDIEEIWVKHKSLRVATGAICSKILKRDVREEWQRHNQWTHQAFGFDIKETRRAIAMTMNNPKLNAIYPLLFYGYGKKECVQIVLDAGIEVPEAYKKGYANNNCAKTGCVQGGIGYWQKIQREEPEKFASMAEREHRLSRMKGEPVTICKDQGKKAKEQGGYVPVFLKKCPDFPDVRDISEFKGREPEPMVDCNGFCGLDDLR